jgi:hypothetical protein
MVTGRRIAEQLAFNRLLVKAAMPERHIEYVDSALADWHCSILSFMPDGTLAVSSR